MEAHLSATLPSPKLLYNLFFRWIFWVDNYVIYRSHLNGNDLIILRNSSKALEVTIDFISEKFYWTDVVGAVFASNLDGSSTERYSFGPFVPFKVDIVRNFVLVTSNVNNSYVLIDREDSSVAIIGTGSNTLYYGINVISAFKKPSIGKLNDNQLILFS